MKNESLKTEEDLKNVTSENFKTKDTVIEKAKKSKKEVSDSKV